LGALHKPAQKPLQEAHTLMSPEHGLLNVNIVDTSKRLEMTPSELLVVVAMCQQFFGKETRSCDHAKTAFFLSVPNTKRKLWLKLATRQQIAFNISTANHYNNNCCPIVYAHWCEKRNMNKNKGSKIL
jgi:hypothetical protein